MYKIIMQQYEKLQRSSRQAQSTLNRGKLRSEEAPLTSSPDARYDFSLIEPGSEAPVDGPLLTMSIVALNHL
jgi:hypothetical protein